MSALSAIALAPLSFLYGGVVRARTALYRNGKLKVAKLAAPVISVGNLTTGGTGKTPLVEYLARKLNSDKRKVCILTRGYRRNNPQAQVVVSDGQNVLAEATAAGDEPRLLAENLQGIAAVISDVDRFAAGQRATEILASDLFILDDGFQHLGLARDFNIATVDATNPWGGGWLLPYGRLREPRRELSRADCIVITRADPATDLESLAREIAGLSNNRPIFVSRMRVRGVRKLEDNLSLKGIRNPDSIEQPVAAFCAIGNPASFRKQLETAGYCPVRSLVYADHFKYDENAIGTLSQTAKDAGAKSLITTAKDAVKLRGLHFDLPCYVLDIEIHIDDESRFLELIRKAISK